MVGRREFLAVLADAGRTGDGADRDVTAACHGIERHIGRRPPYELRAFEQALREHGHIDGQIWISCATPKDA